jgi:hypothetical protein
MQPSTELRWFFEIEVPPGQNLEAAQIPAAVQTWFNGGENGLPKGAGFIDSEARPDTYLSLPDSVDLSVKVRAGKRVEIKRRHIDVGLRTWPGGVEGRVEQWLKWSFALAEKDDKGETIAGPDISAPAGSWLIVDKLRHLRKFEVKAGDKVEAVPKSSFPPQGCNLEITRLVYSNRVWWSLGFESFGGLDTVEKNLDLVMNYIALDFPGVSMLKAEHSYAYPAWLGMVLRSKERKHA